MKTVNVEKLLEEGREKARKGRMAGAVADLILATRGISDGHLLGVLLGVGDSLTNRDAVLAWARRYVETMPMTLPLDAHRVLAHYDEEIRERLDDLETF